MMRRVRFLLGILLVLVIAAGGNAMAASECGHDASYKTMVDAGYPTCTDPGYYTIYCSICDCNYTIITSDPLGHSFDPWYVDTSATCGADGQEIRVCSQCGEVETKPIPATGVHAYGPWQLITAPTCAASGEQKRVCSDCGHQDIKTIAPTGKHQYGEWQVVKVATCQSEGLQQRFCTFCGHKDTQTIPGTSHQFGAWQITVPSTDHSSGTRMHTCGICGFAAAEQFYPDGTLYRGVSAPGKVRSLQQQLFDLGYIDEEPDGVFGKHTEAAVKKFQTAKGFDATGIAFPQTLARLESDWRAVQQAAAATPTPMPTKPPVEATPAPGLLPTPAPKPTSAPQESRKVCARQVDGDGAVHYLYCDTHQVIVEISEALLASASTDARRTAVLQQIRTLWASELDALYAEWAEAVPEDERLVVVNTKTAYAMALASQEMLAAAQNPQDPLAGQLRGIEVLRDQCAELCAMLHGGDEPEEAMGE